jgi:hypothetical protein
MQPVTITGRPEARASAIASRLSSRALLRKAQVLTITASDPS